jgi:hypothetical protein
MSVLTLSTPSVASSGTGCFYGEAGKILYQTRRSADAGKDHGRIG